MFIEVIRHIGKERDRQTESKMDRKKNNENQTNKINRQKDEQTAKKEKYARYHSAITLIYKDDELKKVMKKMFKKLRNEDIPKLIHTYI